MTLDWKAKDTIILGKDLQPGDCIRGKRGSHDTGIVISTTFNDKELKKFYGDEPGIQTHDINCPTDGPFSMRLDIDKEFKLINSREEILYIYEKIEYQLLERYAELMNRRNELVNIKRIAVKRMNDKCDKLKNDI